MSMLKCIECDGIAEYIYNGKSVCKQHLDFESSNGKLKETEYLTLLKEYKGKESTLNYFWVRCTNKHPATTFQNKCNWIRRINKVVEDFNISEKVLQDTLNIAISKNNYDLGFLIQVLKSNQAKMDKKTSEVCKNDDVYAQIAQNTEIAP